MNYVCVKALRLNGVDFKPGEIIPDGAVRSGRERALKSTGYISEVGDGDGTPVVATQPVVPVGGAIEVNVKAESGDVMKITLTQDEAVAVFEALQMTVDESVAAIEKESRENVLIMLHSLDARKGVKSAAKSKAIELSNKDNKNAASGGNKATSDVPEGAGVNNKAE